MPDHLRHGIGPDPDDRRQIPVDQLHAKMPPKEEGVHRWTALAMYHLTAAEAAGAAEGIKTVMKPEMLVSFHIGCIDCEEEYRDARLRKCPAGDEWRDD